MMVDRYVLVERSRVPNECTTQIWIRPRQTSLAVKAAEFEGLVKYLNSWSIDPLHS